MRILIADDHAIVRKGLHDILMEEYPFAEIQECADADDLIKKSMKGKWDVIISDISMPGRGGLDALQQIKEITPETPVLILSMHSEDQYAIRVLKAGAAGFINKESAQDDLIKAVRVVLTGKKYITPSIAEKMASMLTRNQDKLPHETLSDREFEVMKQLASGRSLSEIADNLSLSITTISTYRSRILTKLGISTNADLTRYAVEHSLI